MHALPWTHLSLEALLYTVAALFTAVPRISAANVLETSKVPMFRTAWLPEIAGQRFGQLSGNPANRWFASFKVNGCYEGGISYWKALALCYAPRALLREFSAGRIPAGSS
jgi:hypothetical protein